MGKIQQVVGKCKKWFTHEIHLGDLGQPEKSIKFSEESRRIIHEMGNVELYELGQVSVQCQSCSKHQPEGLTFLFLVAFVFDLMKKQYKGSKPDAKL